MQVLQRLRQQVGDGTGGSAQAHPPGQAFDLPAHFVQRQVRVSQQAAGTGQQGFADGRGPYLATGAGEQRGADARLQFGHVQADGGRRQIKLAGGLGERAKVGDDHQGTEAVEADFAHGQCRPFRGGSTSR
ncbi:hypothetical protein D9M71_794820 [compost metagenome]